MAKQRKDMLIREVLEYGDTDKIADVLYSFGMHCLGCALSHGETIEQAAEAHGVPADDIISALEKVID